MKITILDHARERMERYNVTEAMVRDAIEKPDSMMLSHCDRRIAQKRLGRHILRVIYERRREEYFVVTVYKARPERHEI